MRGKTILAAVTIATAVTVGTMVPRAGAAAGAAPLPAITVLPGSVAPFTRTAPVAGIVDGSRRLTIQIWLRPRIAAAEQYATAVSTPGSPLFHHYLSPAAYTARFAASRAVARSVAAWLRSRGFADIAADAHRSYVRATASASVIDAAFRTRLTLYRSSPGVSAGPYQLRANDRPVSLPAWMAGTVLGVTGLDNAAPVRPLVLGSRRVTAAQAAGCSQYYGQHVVTGLPRQFGTTSFPTQGCGYSGSQLRSAYGANLANTGRGQTIALVEVGLTRDMFLTLQDYSTAGHLPAPSPQRYAELSLGRGSACGDPANMEEQLDVEASYAMAPSAHQIVIGGDSCDNGDFGLQGVINADLAVLGTGNHALADIASNSWIAGVEGQQPSFLTGIEHAFLLRAAAEGVGMYFGSGDGSGTWAPSDDPFATAVGGTTLGIGKAGQRLFETGWSTAISEQAGGSWLLLGEDFAAGGGPSVLWRQPAYQSHVVPAALATLGGDRGGPVRSVPDISAEADIFTGFAAGMLSFPANKPPRYFQIDSGGTSLATPLIAGIIADAEQGQRQRFGFINPALYRLAGTGAITDVLPLTSRTPARYRALACLPPGGAGLDACAFTSLMTFDDQDPAMIGYTGQVTLPGYDNMTGLGTPSGQRFITALRSLEDSGPLESGPQLRRSGVVGVVGVVGAVGQ
jgi:subtilase family serine protease